MGKGESELPCQSKYSLTLEDATKEKPNFIEISNKPYDLLEISCAFSCLLFR
jgi:transcriptional antiterminator Rof (Rho-off)